MGIGGLLPAHWPKEMKALPISTFMMEIPAILDPKGSGRTNKIQKAAVKYGLRQALKIHHRKRIPKHFMPHAKTKYKHQKRGKGWIIRKRIRYRSSTDLVASRKTKIKMTRTFGAQQIRVSGGIEGATGKLILKFPFPTNRDNPNPQSVTIDKMAREIETWAPEEEKEAAQDFKHFFALRYRSAIQSSPKLRKRITIP